MEKIKLFVHNIFIYGFGGIVSKIVPIIMLPIIARIMPNPSYYGLNDLTSAITSIGSSVAVLGMYDAMFRLFFDKDDVMYQKQICSTAFAITGLFSIFVAVILLLMRNQIANFVYNNEKYVFLVVLASGAILAGATNTIVSAPTKMQNRGNIFILTNAISPIIAYTIAIILLYKKKYAIALPLSTLIASILIEAFFLYINREWFQLRYISREYIRPLLKIGIPLLPNFIIYWIYNSSDKIMLQHFLDTTEVGIYAMGAKCGQISQLIYMALTGGWLYFAYSTMKEKTQVENNSRIFEVLGVISFVATMFVCAISYTMYYYIFPIEYLPAYVVAPFLFLSPLLQMIYQIASNQFMIMKRVWPSVLILFVGAIINIVLNLILIPVNGIEGAAIATLFGYITSVIICVLVLKRMKCFYIYNRFVLVVIMFSCYVIIWRLIFSQIFLISFLLAVIITSIIGVLYFREIKILIKAFI